MERNLGWQPVASVLAPLLRRLCTLLQTVLALWLLWRQVLLLLMLSRLALLLRLPLPTLLPVAQPRRLQPALAGEEALLLQLLQALMVLPPVLLSCRPAA